MDAQQKRRLLGDGALIIIEMGAVGSPDLDEPGPTLGHNVGNAERSADFDQLPSGDYGLTATSQGVEADEHRGCVVVDHQAGLSPGKQAEQVFDQAVPAAPLAAFEVELEVGIITSGLDKGIGSRFREDGTTKIGMNDYPGTINDTAKVPPQALGEALGKEIFPLLGGFVTTSGLPGKNPGAFLLDKLLDDMLEEHSRL